MLHQHDRQGRGVRNSQRRRRPVEEKCCYKKQLEFFVELELIMPNSIGKLTAEVCSSRHPEYIRISAGIAFLTCSRIASSDMINRVVDKLSTQARIISLLRILERGTRDDPVFNGIELASYNPRVSDFRFGPLASFPEYSPFS